MSWETVIGLEIHAELNTKSKLFSTAPNRFGDEPNCNISVVCTGQPGSLPVLNKEAVKKAVQFGCAVDGQVQKFSKFDRKSYFYPDSPRNFQITQFDQPIILGGKVVAEVESEEKCFEINRVHIEDDAGMLKHFSAFAGVDYNRAGVPLIEIVSEPCIHSPKEAKAYAKAVRAIIQYIDASDCNMEEGSLRFDANISVRKVGEEGLRPKVEIKNMNSFTFLELAIEAEVQRQVRLYESHPDKAPSELIKQSTYRWDAERKETVLMRGKETSDDYRYFPEPDLVPIILTDDYINSIRQTLPELPRQRERRYKEELQLTEYNAQLLISDKELSDYFEKGLYSCKNPASLCNWVTVEFVGRLKEQGKTPWNAGILAEHIGELVRLIDDKIITGKIAKKVADDMVKTPGTSPEEIVEKNPDYQPLSDESAIEALVDKALGKNPSSVEDFHKGKDRAFGFLIGQVMKLSRGKAAPQIVNAILKRKLGEQK